MTDLDRLLELARKAKTWQDEQGAWVTMGMFAPLVVSNFIEKVQPQTIIGLIDALITLEARLRAAEKRADHWQREHDRQRADNQPLRDVAWAARGLLEEHSQRDIEVLRDAFRDLDEVVKE